MLLQTQVKWKLSKVTMLNSEELWNRYQCTLYLSFWVTLMQNLEQAMRRTHTKRNGKFLSELIQEKEFVIANTSSRNEGERNGHMWTPGNKHQLDCILNNKKWKNRIMNRWTYNTFSSIGSDGSVVAYQTQSYGSSFKP